VDQRNVLPTSAHLVFDAVAFVFDPHRSSLSSCRNSALVRRKTFELPMGITTISLTLQPTVTAICRRD
jgi:hypothetical protein